MAGTVGKDLQYLLDRQAIEDCLYGYAHAVDRHDVELIPRVYHPDAIDDHGKFLGTVPQFLQYVNGAHEFRTRAHTHNITTVNCDLQGDVAHTESYVLWALFNKDASSVMMGSGRYIDRLEKRAGEWRIALRRTVTELRMEADSSVWHSHPGGYEHSLGRWDRSDPTFERPLDLPPVLKAALAAKGPPPPVPAKAPAPARSPEAALRHLLDRRAIKDVIRSSCRGLDRHDRDLLAGAFHPDAVDSHPSFVGYVPELVEHAIAETERNYFAQTHNMTTHSAEIDGDTAHAETYAMIVLRERDQKTVSVGGGRYLDRLERRDGVWKIALRRLIMEWRFTADGTVFNADDGYTHGTRDGNDLSYMRPLDLTDAQRARLAAAK